MLFLYYSKYSLYAAAIPPGWLAEKAEKAEKGGGANAFPLETASLQLPLVAVKPHQEIIIGIVLFRAVFHNISRLAVQQGANFANRIGRDTFVFPQLIDCVRVNPVGA